MLFNDKHHPNWSGIGELSGKYWGNLKAGAKRRGYMFSISIEEGWKLFEKQNKLCAMSGVPITFRTQKADSPNQSASLDRIDSSKGYIPGNVQWIHKTLNKLKLAMPNDEFISWCKLVGKYNEI